MQAPEDSVLPIRDGIYIGNATATHSLNLVVKYKIFHIINCSAGELQNHFENIGIRYLNFDWKDEEGEEILDDGDKNLAQIEMFMNYAKLKQENVLIASVNGKCRACTITIACLMKSYKLPLYEAIQFVSTKKPDLQLRKGFLEQLSRLEKRLFPTERPLRSIKWIEDDEWLVKPKSPGFQGAENPAADRGQKEKLRPYNSEPFSPVLNNSERRQESLSRQNKPILKRRDQQFGDHDGRIGPNKDSDLTSIQEPSITQTSTLEDQVQLQHTGTHSTQPEQEVYTNRPVSGIRSPFGDRYPNGIKPNSTRIGFGLKPAIEEQRVPKMVHFENDDRTVYNHAPELQARAFRTPRAFERGVERGRELNIAGGAQVYSVSPSYGKEKNYLAEVRAETPKFNARPGKFDPVETFYGKAFIAQKSPKQEKALSIQKQIVRQQPNSNYSKHSQVYNELYREAFLPDLYEKYQPKPVETGYRSKPPGSHLIDILGRNDALRKTRMNFEVKENENRRSNSFHNLKDLLEQKKETPQNLSMVEYKKEKSNQEITSQPTSPSKYVILGLRDYYSDTQSSQTSNPHAQKIVERDRFKADFAKAGVNQDEKKVEFQTNPSYNFSLSRPSPNHDNEIRQSRVSPLSIRRKEDVKESRNYFEKGGYYGLMKQEESNHDEEVRRVEGYSPPVHQNEYERLMPKKNHGGLNLQPAETIHQTTTIKPTAVNMMKTKFGPFELKQLTQPTQKALHASNKNSPVRTRTIFEEADNQSQVTISSLVYQNPSKGYARKNDNMQLYSPSSNTGSTGNRSGGSEYSQIRHFEGLHLRNRLLLQEQDRTQGRLRSSRIIFQDY